MSSKKKSKYRTLNHWPEARNTGVKSKEARHVYVPHYETLTLKKIFEFLNDGHGQVFQYLPDLQEIDKIGREWICNIIATIIQDKFVDWVAKQVNDRNELIVEKGDLAVEMDDEIFAAFQSSTAVSRKYQISSSVFIHYFL